MSRNAWLLVLVLVAASSLAGGIYLAAQPRPGPDGPQGFPGGPHRYQVVRASADVIILLDTMTGDLYNAVPSDIKPYNQRPRPQFMQPGPRGTDKDTGPREFPRDGDKDRPQYRDKIELRDGLKPKDRDEGSDKKPADRFPIKDRDKESFKDGDKDKRPDADKGPLKDERPGKERPDK
jgi:hypothetical protein